MTQAHLPGPGAPKISFITRCFRWFAPVFAVGLGGALAGALLLVVMLCAAYANLPTIETLTDYRPKIPLRVWSADGVLLGEFGEERRDYVSLRDVPVQLRRAILAAEDDRFYEHSGVDYLGLARAALANFTSGRRGQGGSTITMQIARTFFLSSEKLYTRKLYEIVLALKIEALLPKDRILEVYVNQIFLGQRAYGFSAAAQTYFGKRLKDLSVAEMATLAGLPVAPSAYNPWVNPARARARKNYVLGRMRTLNFIDEATYEQAVAEELKPRAALVASAHVPERASGTNAAPGVHAQYVAEMARQAVFETFHEETYTRGLNVFTTINSVEQQAAWSALRQQALDYDRRYGYRGPEAFIDLPDVSDDKAREQRIEEALAEAIDSPDLFPAVVLEAGPKKVLAQMQGSSVEITGEGLKFAARSLDAKAQPNRKIRAGALVRLSRMPKGGWEIVQLPQVESAFVAAEAGTGAVRALVGGFDFNLNKFNHVTQAWRQPGSAFKPFIYSAALERGFMPSTLVNDAPLAVDPEMTGGQVWEPKNYDGTFEGPMRLRQALAKSKNLVSIRVLQAIGPHFAQAHAARFGFEPSKHPPYLTLALGAGSVTAWQLLSGYGTFSNSGLRMQPYLIAKVTDAQGKVVMEADPRAAGALERVLDERNAFVMHQLLSEITRTGTAARATALKRTDLAGKTGTTNDSHDAWFAGYGGGLVAVAWMGFDQPRPLGERETGGGLALPIWMNYMEVALKDRPEVVPPMPEGVVNVGGEYYLEEFQPGHGVASIGLEDGLPAEQHKAVETVRDQIF